MKIAPKPTRITKLRQQEHSNEIVKVQTTFSEVKSIGGEYQKKAYELEVKKIQNGFTEVKTFENMNSSSRMSKKSSARSIIKKVFHPKIDEFLPTPVIKLKEHPKERFFNRMLSLLVAIVVCYTIVGIKTNLRDNYNLAAFCALGDSTFWEDFQHKVETGENQLIKFVDCRKKCAGTFPYFFSFLFRLDEEFEEWIVHALLVYFLGLANTRIGYFCAYVSPPLFRVLAIFLFPDNVLLCNSIIIFLYAGSAILLLLESKERMWIYISLQVPFAYFVLVSLFLQYVIKGLFAEYPRTMRNIWPVIIFGLQFLFTKLLQHPIYEKYHLKVRICLMVNYMVFEYLEIGNLHQIVIAEGLQSQELWVTLLIALILNLDKKMLFTKRLVAKALDKLNIGKQLKKREKKKFEIGSLEAMYIELKLEIELFSHFVYAFLITLKLYVECVTSLVDCSGRPLVNVSPVWSEHYILCIILVLSSVIQIFFKIGLNYFKYQEMGYNPRLLNVMDYIFYVFAMNMVCFRYCVNSLYVMFAI